MYSTLILALTFLMLVLIPLLVALFLVAVQAVIVLVLAQSKRQWLSVLLKH